MKEVKKPWGSFKQFVLNKKCTVKLLVLKPKQELSLQVHRKRSEIWYFFGRAVVQLGKRKIKVSKGKIIRIPKNTPHRIKAGKEKVKILEISLGKFSERDEKRLEDKYGRN